MSSFIISKVDYVKAAGLLYGVEESKRDYHKYYLDNLRKGFEHVYALNVISVNNQYGDKAIPESNTYNKVFEKYRGYGRAMHTPNSPMTFVKFRFFIMSFFSSVLYQIEDDYAHRTAASFFWDCTKHLFEREIRQAQGWWGDIEFPAAA